MIIAEKQRFRILAIQLQLLHNKYDDGTFEEFMAKQGDKNMGKTCVDIAPVKKDEKSRYNIFLTNNCGSYGDVKSSCELIGKLFH